MHYKGKNHAKKLKSIGTGTGPEVFECKICCVTVTAQEHLTAHLNGARHKLQVRKLDTTEIYRGGGLRGRGRGLGFRGKGRGGRGVGKVNDGDWRPLQEERPNRGTGFRGRGHTSGDLPWRGAGFKRRGGDDGLPYRGGFGPQFSKRARF
uniref:C2H2-type domain-containing protein n=1 Tax=Arion vulgaris TaxID=1028688 RepID=A0A0B6ZYS0_9EUPU